MRAALNRIEHEPLNGAGVHATGCSPYCKRCELEAALASSEGPRVPQIAPECILHEHNYFYSKPNGIGQSGYYYCLCGWEGRDRKAYWEHLDALAGITAPLAPVDAFEGLKRSRIKHQPVTRLSDIEDAAPPAPTFKEPLRAGDELLEQIADEISIIMDGWRTPTFPWVLPLLRSYFAAAPPPTASFGGTVGLDGDTRRDWETDGPTFERQAAIYRHALEEIARGGDRALAAEALYNGQSPGAEKLAWEQKTCEFE